MEALRTENLTFFYPDRQEAALKNINFTVEEGSFVTLCGVSGCGKTTLLRQFKSVLAPHGERTGQVLLQGKLLEDWDRREQTGKIGFVLQTPDSQIVTDKVWHELAFGLESLGYETEAIRLRVAEMASYFGIQDWFHKNVSELSGGQKQLLNLAAVMTMQPSVLLLDEPTSQLDPIAAADFLNTVAKLNRELGLTVVMTEHRLEEALPLSDRVVVMDGGRILADGSPRQVGKQLGEMRHEMFDAMPAPVRIWCSLETAGERCPLTIREGRQWLESYRAAHILRDVPPKERRRQEGRPALQIEEAWFRYEHSETDIIKGLSFTIYPGEFCAVLGGNGAGKTTMLSLLAGLRKPDRGRVLLDGRTLEDIPSRELFDGMVGMLPQEPQALFTEKTVESDLREMLEGKSLPGEEAGRRMEQVCRLCELEPLLTAHPYDLSGGEQQRAALAKVLLTAPAVLLLDEPTKGLDAHFKKKLAAILARLKAQGTAILMVSHDVEFCARYADRCALFFDGGIVTQGPPEEFFAGNSFYTTAANRMARQMLPKAVTAEDVVCACGGQPIEIPVEEPPKVRVKPEIAAPARAEQAPKGKGHLPKRTLAAACMILLLIPATIWFGMTFLEDRRYYFISLLVLLEVIAPFFLIFESRKPQARELVVLAVLCAVAVASRVGMSWLPHFKPVTALVIVAGVAFGGESGFLVGAVTAFASNFYFGQGPWTPWQMFAWGMIGFLAGILFQREALRRCRAVLSVFGGVVTLVIYGGIMNTWSVISVQGTLNWPMIWASCLKGLPLDLVHAAATMLFLLVGARPMLDKLERVKEKYGLMRQ